MKNPQIALLLFGVVVLMGLTTVDTGAAASSTGTFGSQWQSLVGEWNGESPSGGSSGACGFHLDLSGHIITRTNHAELAAAPGRPAGVHDDLMIIYPGPTEDKAKAIYFDNEGHVIEYSVEWSADGNLLTFLTKPGAGPQFRLTYKKTGPEKFLVAFEMAAPGQPGSFKPYTSGTIKRTGK
ncbi:MAG TPA: hypothetical protein VJA21_05170 [Verrucomicrobiae bacterium]